MGASGWQRHPRRGSKVVRHTAARRVRTTHKRAVLPAAVLYLLVATGLAGVLAAVLHRGSDAPAVSRTHLVSFGQQARYLVLIVLDGARPDYLDVAHLPNLDALRAEGVQYTTAMDGILESETPSGHTTLATGSTPARTGILGFDWAQSDSDYSLFSPDIVRSGAMELIMDQAKVPTIAGLFKGRYPNAKVVALSGHKYYAADPLGGPQADAIMYYQGDQQGRYVPVAIPGHMPPNGVLNDPSLIGPSTHLPYGAEDRLATKLALSSFRTMHQQITLINYPEFDWPLGHVDGSNHRRVVQLMRELDHDLGMLKAAYRKAGVLKKTLFVITADHGMSPIKRFVPQTEITNAVARAGTTAPSISYSTGTYVWLADQTKAQAVASNILGAHDPGIQSVYYIKPGGTGYSRAGGKLVDTTVDAANRYLLSSLLNAHRPSVVVLCRAGSTTSSPDTHWKGDHGGANWDSQHIPLVLAGPGIAQGQIETQPAQLDDVAPTVLADMGVKPSGMQGRVLTEALQRSTTQQQGARAGEIRLIAPFAGALMLQDTYEKRG